MGFLLGACLRIFWVMISKARDRTFHIMFLTSQHRCKTCSLSRPMSSGNHLSCTSSACKFGLDGGSTERLLMSFDLFIIRLKHKIMPTFVATQSGFAVDYITQGAQAGFSGSFVNQHSEARYSRFDAGNDFMSQVCVGHGSHGLFMQVGFDDPSRDDASQSQFGVANANPLQSQGLLNPLFSQPFAHYNSQPSNLQAPQQQQGQSSQYHKLHYIG